MGVRPFTLWVGRGLAGSREDASDLKGGVPRLGVVPLYAFRAAAEKGGVP